MINTVVTSTGIRKTIEAQNNEGYFIRFDRFSISSSKGALNASRTAENDSGADVWFGRTAITAFDKPDATTIQISCGIPTGYSMVEHFAAEIYIWAVDNEANEFLFAIGQPDPVQVYDPNGSLTFRIAIRLQNASAAATYTFTSTIATELASHNIDLAAHPAIRASITSDIATHNTAGNAHSDIRGLITSGASDHDGNANAHQSIRDSITSQISTHNTAGNAHSDMRGLISRLENATTTNLSTHNLDTTAHTAIQNSIGTRIQAHNTAGNTHSDIRDLLEYAGAYNTSAERRYTGQPFDQFPRVAAGVVNGDFVYQDSFGTWNKSEFNSFTRARASVMGMYVSTGETPNKAVVVNSGIVSRTTDSTIPIGGNVYFSYGSSGGAITSSAPTLGGIYVGRKLPDNKLFLDIKDFSPPPDKIRITLLSTTAPTSSNFLLSDRSFADNQSVTYHFTIRTTRGTEARHSVGFAELVSNHVATGNPTWNVGWNEVTSSETSPLSHFTLDNQNNFIAHINNITSGVGFFGEVILDLVRYHK